jgi:miniconductance mechanosensitive channel
MNLNSLLERFGLQEGRLTETVNILFTMLVVSLIGWVAYVAAKKLLPRLVRRIAGTTRHQWSEWLLDQRFFNRLALLFMPIVLRAGLSPIQWKHMPTINRLLDIWIVVASALLASAFLGGINRVYEKMANVRDKPVKIITQVIAVVIWCAVVLIIISIFTHESLAVLLGGLTAFAAVLMLVFQDPILGFVAGIQLSSNNMVRLGDWIVMPSRGVDGEVREIGLTTVKVQNWDKTITTIPTHKLVSESFTNWRGMEESGGRRIKRSVNIDVASIHYLSDEELATLGASQLLHRYMEKKLAVLASYNANRASDLDERRLTNIGTFREYMEQWIENNPDIHQGMTHMVRQLQPGPTGLPIEIYCFSARQSWIDYENVQSDLFDHIYAVMPLFNLRAFQYSGEVAVPEN